MVIVSSVSSFMVVLSAGSMVGWFVEDCTISSVNIMVLGVAKRVVKCSSDNEVGCSAVSSVEGCAISSVDNMILGPAEGVVRCFSDDILGCSV